MLMMPVAILMGCVLTTSGRTLIFNLDGSTGSNLPVNFFHEQVNRLEIDLWYIIQLII